MTIAFHLAERHKWVIFEGNCNSNFSTAFPLTFQNALLQSKQRPLLDYKTAILLTLKYWVSHEPGIILSVEYFKY